MKITKETIWETPLPVDGTMTSVKKDVPANTGGPTVICC